MRLRRADRRGYVCRHVGGGKRSGVGRHARVGGLPVDVVAYAGAGAVLPAVDATEAVVAVATEQASAQTAETHSVSLWAMPPGQWEATLESSEHLPTTVMSHPYPHRHATRDRRCARRKVPQRRRSTHGRGS